MSVIALCSLKGSPGVTTAALALATSTTADTVLVEADSAGGDLAARVGFPSEPGLASLAAAGRRELDARLVEQHRQHVAGIDIVAAPVGASAARSALGVLGDALAAALKSMRETIVVCDLGRLDAGSASLGILRAADLVLVVTRPLLADIAHVAEEIEPLSRLGPPVVLVLSGEPGAGRRERYPAAEVSATLGLEVLGSLAWDPKGVAALVGHRAALKRSALVESARSLSVDLVRRLPGVADKAVTPVQSRQVADPAPVGAEL